jgi:EAL domain-containing protein (putative c-di-GMP-specific phosphodiesterase class I)
VAEQAGLITALTDSILDQSLAACARWRLRRPDCWVAVNLSPLLLNDPTLTERILGKLQRYDVPPGALVLEVTENNGIPDTACATEILTRLRIKGVNLSVDDFGTGHSSLLSLVRMPFSEMKIDQAFVRDALTNRDALKVVRASASLGRELGLNVVAEGVETDEAAQVVKEAGCHVGQGWLYGKAVPPDAFEEQLGLAQFAPSRKDAAEKDAAATDTAPVPRNNGTGS